jgi:vomeronasal1 receptor
MVWTSVSMVLLLHRHHHKMQHIFTTNRHYRGQAETRATSTILMLVVTFVSFYLLNFTCIIIQALVTDSHAFVRHWSEALVTGFPTISPLLLIFRKSKDPCSVFFRLLKSWVSKNAKHRDSFINTIKYFIPWICFWHLGLTRHGAHFCNFKRIRL